MSTMMANDFSYFDLSPEEQRAGQILTTAQVHVIQNLLSATAIECLNVEDVPLNPMKSSLQRAALQGAISVYRRLINESQQAVMDQYDEAKAAADLNEQKKTVMDAYQAFKMQFPDTPSTLDTPTQTQ